MSDLNRLFIIAFPGLEQLCLRDSWLEEKRQLKSIAPKRSFNNAYNIMTEDHFQRNRAGAFAMHNHWQKILYVEKEA